jgi:phosphoribosyl-ATP pyrophosphohydrolase/phosphoribosyl-AMP cyclohydrolase
MNYGFISALKTPFKCEEKMQILKRVMWLLYLNWESIKLHRKKVEAVEVVIEAKDDNDDLFLSESADLLFIT